MTDLTAAHQELFRRPPDEMFGSFDELVAHCRQERQFSNDVWQLPQTLDPHVSQGRVTLSLESEVDVELNDWSFTQLCRMSGVSKDTLNRLSPETASLALRETLPRREKPIQLLETGGTVRSMHGPTYTRLWNADLLDVVQDYAGDFQPPQKAVTGATGLYCGQQDLFAFLIDPTGWTEINGECFAPGFFVYNSEVGKRSLGIQTFWFQKVCANHIVWDAIDVVDFSRKHTANVHEGLNDIRRIIERLVIQRDDRRDGFVRAIRNAMSDRLGDDAAEAAKSLLSHGIPRNLAKEALEIARTQGGFTIFAVVDALTRLTQKLQYAGDRMTFDLNAASLLSLAV